VTVTALLHLTPRQLYEAARLADRLGPAYAHQLDSGRLLLLLATRFRPDGQLEPDLALELAGDGRVVASQYLDLAHSEDPDDLSDLSDERPLPPSIDVSHARPAKVCECDEPLGHDGLCVVCGRTLRDGVGALREAA
jgi:hypothetical protein